MNILINLKKLINKELKNQLISTQITIIHNYDSLEYKGIFKDAIIVLNTNVDFVQNEKYEFIISLAVLGNQIIKEKYSFIYKTDEEYQLCDDKISLKITKNNIDNKIKIVNEISADSFQNYEYRINPLAVVRQEDNEKMTIYLNGNVYILKGSLMKAIKAILQGEKFKESVIKSDKIEDIILLISKGCIICYE